jgi:hypothetical protein
MARRTPAIWQSAVFETMSASECTLGTPPFRSECASLDMTRLRTATCARHLGLERKQYAATAGRSAMQFEMW